MKEFFDFRNKEFREYFLNHTIPRIHDELKDLSLFNKEEINDNDLIQFYFAYSNSTSEIAEVEFTRAIFNYKMNRISKDRLNKFYEITRSRTGRSLALRYKYYEFAIIVRSDEFNELVDIFLDVI